MKKIETLQLSYRDSMVLRGIAILMMIFLHCFNYQPQDTYVDVVFGGRTLAWWLTRICGLCVPLYCFLSGYGLYKKYPYDYAYCGKKTWILVKRYWIFLFLFWGLGVYFFNTYTTAWKEILSNFLGYDTTYNPTLWFLLPYLIVMLASPMLIKAFNSNKLWKSVAIVTLLYGGASFCLKMHSLDVWAIPSGLRVLLEAMRLLFSFMCGALFAKYGIPRLNFFSSSVVKNNLVLLLLLALLMAVRALIDNQIASPPYAQC